MLVNIGYGNVVNMDKVLGIIRADAAPIKRMIQVAKDENTAVDATCGRKTKCILVMDGGYMVLSAMMPETIQNRFSENTMAERGERGARNGGRDE